MLIEITLSSKTVINFKFGTKILDKDKTYIIQHTWVDDIICEKYKVVLTPYTIDINPETEGILFIRSIGMGDILFLSPLISLIKDKYPNCKIGFATINSQHELLKLIPGIDEIIEYPIEKEIFDKYKYQFTVEGLIEGNIENINNNIYEVYLNHICQDITNIDKKYLKPIISINNNQIPIQQKIIAIHPFAIDSIRQLNLHCVILLIKILVSIGYNVIILSNQIEKDKFENLFENIENVSWAIDKTSNIQEIINLLKACECIVSTDSFYTHFSQAINLKCYCIYGPFSSNSRVGTYTNITIIDTNPDCRCSSHGIGHCPKGYSITPCLSFEPQMIIDLITKGEFHNEIDINAPTINKYNWSIQCQN